ncbi:MAG TPA: hypothetical protein VGE26_02045 [Sphingobacteriaceae bacterium]
MSLWTCKKDKKEEPSIGVVYKQVNQSVRYWDPNPIIADMNNDGKVDFTFWSQIVAYGGADHLYFGISTIGQNQARMMSGLEYPFLNCLKVQAQDAGSVIEMQTQAGTSWSSESGMLVIRHSGEHSVAYEGHWHDESQKMLAVRLLINGKYHFGWVRLKYNKEQPGSMTLVDFAWNKKPEQSIKAGQR